MSRGEKLFVKMQRSKYGWEYRDFDLLYTHFGFEKTEGSEHSLYIHPQFSELRGSVSRHKGDLAIGYVQHAIKMIKKLKELIE